MADEKDKVYVAWGTFSTHIKSMLSELMTSQMFTDDNKHIKAHRNILSGSSPVLKLIFNIDVQNMHPIIYNTSQFHIAPHELKKIAQAKKVFLFM